MSEADLAKLLDEAPEAEEKWRDLLASQLVWRVGRLDDGPLTVRLGFATSAALFANLPKLRGATDQEVEAALRTGELRVEWVGQGP
jgi:hypothetical protein